MAATDIFPLHKRHLFTLGHRVMFPPPQRMANISEPQMYEQEATMYIVLCVGSSCSFIYGNLVLLFTLRSKAVFCETARYMLLFNLLLADTSHMTVNLLLYVFAAMKIAVTYQVCGIFILLSLATNTSPYILAVMSLEQYVAVCHPLRHPSVFTTRNTSAAIALVWGLSFIDVVIRLSILLYSVTKISVSLRLSGLCSKEAFFFMPVFDDFEDVHVSTLFVSVGLAMITSYIGVGLVARSAQTNKKSAEKALRTLLLHLFQLCLILTSTCFSTIILAIVRLVGRVMLLRIYNVCFVCLNILPRCLSALLYGARDQRIRLLLFRNLCCGMRCSVFCKES